MFSNGLNLWGTSSQGVANSLSSREQSVAPNNAKASPELEAAEAEIVALKASLEEAFRQKIALEQAAQEAAAKEAAECQQLETARASAAELRKELEAKEATHTSREAALVAELAELQDKISTVATLDAVSGLEGSAASFGALKVDERDTLVSELRAELEQTRGQIQSLEQSLARLKSKCKRLGDRATEAEQYAVAVTEKSTEALRLRDAEIEALKMQLAAHLQEQALGTGFFAVPATEERVSAATSSSFLRASAEPYMPGFDADGLPEDLDVSYTSGDGDSESSLPQSKESGRAGKPQPPTSPGQWHNLGPPTFKWILLDPSKGLGRHLREKAARQRKREEKEREQDVTEVLMHGPGGGCEPPKVTVARERNAANSPRGPVLSRLSNVNYQHSGVNRVIERSYATDKPGQDPVRIIIRGGRHNGGQDNHSMDGQGYGGNGGGRCGGGVPNGPQIGGWASAQNAGRNHGGGGGGNGQGSSSGNNRRGNFNARY